MTNQHDEPRTDEVTGTKTTGHEWDGIEELNTPLPKWWLYVFYASIVWSIGYYVVYPSFPFFNGEKWTFAKGVSDYSQRSTVREQLADARSAYADDFERMRALPVDEIFQDEKLRTIAARAGESHFGTNCAGCHGSGAQGYTAFPNLRDDDWLW
ncbi:MAG: cbb3-type cytochrome c oxidase N-terminal domain-containing protein, partial [Pseudomonadota bacterium]